VEIASPEVEKTRFFLKLYSWIMDKLVPGFSFVISMILERNYTFYLRARGYRQVRLEFQNYHRKTILGEKQRIPWTA
jgi:hypothetical protein